MDLTYIIKRPLLTEKSTFASNELGRYSFVVDRKASKADIKKAVETLYNVKVERVNTSVSMTKAKVNRFGPTGGKDIKKAVVKLAEGQKIELF